MVPSRSRKGESEGSKLQCSPQFIGSAPGESRPQERIVVTFYCDSVGNMETLGLGWKCGC